MAGPSSFKDYAILVMLPNNRDENISSTEVRALVSAIGTQTQAIGSLVHVLTSQNQVTSALIEIIRTSHGDHENRLRVVEASTIQLKERMTVWQIVQASYSTLAAAGAAIGAAIGLRGP